jgi:hypothetical protein
MTELAEELKKLRYGLAGGLSDEAFVARVMEGCRSAPRVVASRSRRRVWPYGGAALAAAACVVLGIASWPQPRLDAPDPRGTVAARGDARTRLRATVQAFVGRAELGSTAPLLEGASLRPGDGILVRYSNPAAEPAYLMVFALDERGSVHWIHPAYLDESQNPSSLPLIAGLTQQVLPEVAEPEDAAPGALRVYALLTRAALDVKQVERRLAQRQEVSELFPEAEVEEWRCTWTP